MFSHHNIFCFFLSVTFLFSTVSSHVNIYPAPVQLERPPGRDVGDALILTPFIEAGEIEKARELSRVKNLTNVISYSGYFNVNPKYNSSLFFWFFPSAYQHHTAPLLLWLQGGPGASSLLGLFNENGPFVIDEGNNVNFRETAWTLTHSVLYIDNPVGTGYSFTQDDRGYAQNQDDVARDLYSALVQFFLMFPSYIKNDFYLSGESYAGKYLPALGHKIHYENHHTPPFKINMKGLAIGSGFSDPVSMLGYGSYLHNIGFLDYETKLYFDQEEDRARTFIQQDKYLEAFQVMDALFLGWETTPSYYTNQTGFKRYYNYLLSHEPPEMNYYSSFVQQDHVRRSIHVGNGSFTNSFTEGKVEKYLRADIFKSVKPWVEELLNATENYKILLYGGQLDIVVATPLMDNYIRSLKWKNAAEFSKAPRKIWRVGKDIAGYVKHSGSLTELVVRNAGHLVPGDQPGWSFDMISRFTSGKSFASSSHRSVLPVE